MRALAPVLLMTCLGLTTASSGALIVSDNFSDGNYTASPAWTVNAGTWDASTGELQQTATGAVFANPPKTISLNGVTETTPSTTITADMKIETTHAPGNDFVGITFRMQSATQMYAIYFFPDWGAGGDLQMQYINGSTYTQVGTTHELGFVPGAGTYSTMTLEIQPLNQFKVTVQSGANSFNTTFTDSTLTNGGIGLISRIPVTFAGDAGVFDNVAVNTVDAPEPTCAAMTALMSALLLRRKRRAQ